MGCSQQTVPQLAKEGAGQHTAAPEMSDPQPFSRLWTLNILGGSDWLSLVTCPLAVLGKERECPTPGDWWC